MEPLVLKYERVILRDRLPADMEDHRRWLFTETAWMNWDAPWEKNDPRANELYLDRCEERLNQPLPAIRSTLEICLWDGTHIGLVNSYNIGDDRDRLAVGIGLRESRFWGRGLGTEALLPWLAYQFAAGRRQRLYCQTWSGNLRMVKLAGKVGFRECQRQRGCCQVEGQLFDALTYVLYQQDLWNSYPRLQKALR